MSGVPDGINKAHAQRASDRAALRDAVDREYSRSRLMAKRPGRVDTPCSSATGAPYPPCATGTPTVFHRHPARSAPCGACALSRVARCALDAHVRTRRGAMLPLRVSMLRSPRSNAVRSHSNAASPHSNASSPRSNAPPPHSSAASPRSNAVPSAWEPSAVRVGTLCLRVAVLRHFVAMIHLCIAMLPTRKAMLRLGIALLHAPRSSATPPGWQRCVPALQRFARAQQRYATARQCFTLRQGTLRTRRALAAHVAASATLRDVLALPLDKSSREDCRPLRVRRRVRVS